MNQLSENKVLFDESLPHPLVVFMIISIQTPIPLISCCKSNAVISFLPFCVSRNNIYPNLDHAAFFNSIPNGSCFLNINNYCVVSPLGVIRNHMPPINYSATFSAPEEIFLHNLLKPPKNPHTIQKVLVPFFLWGRKWTCTRGLGILESCHRNTTNL